MAKRRRLHKNIIIIRSDHRSMVWSNGRRKTFFASNIFLVLVKNLRLAGFSIIMLPEYFERSHFRAPLTTSYEWDDNPNYSHLPTQLMHFVRALQSNQKPLSVLYPNGVPKIRLICISRLYLYAALQRPICFGLFGLFSCYQTVYFSACIGQTHSPFAGMGCISGLCHT